jgi:hypothetical protein
VGETERGDSRSEQKEIAAVAFPMAPETIALLRLFNAQADRLLRLSYFDKVKGGGALLEWKDGFGWEQIFVATR